MNTKYYNASNNFSAPISREPRPYAPYSYRSETVTPRPAPDSAPPVKKIEAEGAAAVKSARELSLKTDDFLLIGLIILLLPDAENNLMLILILGYLLVMGMN